MKQSYRYLLKNTAILTLSNFSSKILVFLLVPMYTSALSTDEYGTYDLIISTVQLLAPVLTLNIASGVMRYSMDKSCDMREVATIGMKYVCYGTAVFLLACIVYSRLPVAGSVRDLMPYIFFYFVCYIFNEYFTQLAKGMERIKDMAIAGTGSTIVLFGGTVWFLLVWRGGIKGFLCAGILSQAFALLFLALRLHIWKELCRIHRGTNLQKEILQYSIPLIITTIGWWVNNVLDKYVVALVLGVGANGLLSVAYKIPGVMNVIQAIFMQAWHISAVKEYENQQAGSFYESMFVSIHLVMSFGCSVLILLDRPLAQILYAKDFYEAWRYAPFLLVANVLNTMSGFLGPLLSAAKNSTAMAKSGFYGTTVNILLNFVLVYIIGIQGAVIATVISSLVIYLIRKNSVGDVLQVKKYYRILLTWALLCVQAAAEIWADSYTTEVVLITGIIFVNREPICLIIRRLFDRIYGERIEHGTHGIKDRKALSGSSGGVLRGFVRRLISRKKDR